LSLWLLIAAGCSDEMIAVRFVPASSMADRIERVALDVYVFAQELEVSCADIALGRQPEAALDAARRLRVSATQNEAVALVGLPRDEKKLFVASGYQSSQLLMAGCQPATLAAGGTVTITGEPVLQLESEVSAVGTPLPNHIVSTVRDADGKTIEGVSVEWELRGPDGFRDADLSTPSDSFGQIKIAMPSVPLLGPRHLSIEGRWQSPPSPKIVSFDKLRELLVKNPAEGDAYGTLLEHLASGTFDAGGAPTLAVLTPTKRVDLLSNNKSARTLTTSARGLAVVAGENGAGDTLFLVGRDWQTLSQGKLEDVKTNWINEIENEVQPPLRCAVTRFLPISACGSSSVSAAQDATFVVQLNCASQGGEKLVRHVVVDASAKRVPRHPLVVLLSQANGPQLDASGCIATLEGDRRVRLVSYQSQSTERITIVVLDNDTAKQFQANHGTVHFTPEVGREGPYLLGADLSDRVS
jgi:hypothetical protein